MIARLPSRWAGWALLSCAQLISSGNAMALTESQCTPVRMDQGSGSVAQLPILNQGNAGLCFAYAATQLADAWRFSRRSSRAFHSSSLRPGLPHTTSPIPASFSLAHEERRLNQYEGGTLASAIDQLRTNGSCSHDDVFGPGPTSAFRGPREQSLRTELLEVFDRYIGMLGRRGTGEDRYETPFTLKLRQIQNEHPEWGIQRQSIEAKYQLAIPLAGQLCRFLERESFPLPRAAMSTTIDSTYVLATQLAVSVENMDADTGFVNRYFTNICRGHTEPLADLPELDTKSYGPAQSSQLLGSLHSRLNRRNPQPVSVSYCPNVLTMPHPYNGYSLNQGKVRCLPDPNRPNDDGKTTHASIIVGRRWNAERRSCQLLIRNSWGESCDSDYSARAPWSCGGPGELEGQIWIDEQALGRNAFEVEFLKN